MDKKENRTNSQNLKLETSIINNGDKVLNAINQKNTKFIFLW
jgi:hypothetical protein